MKGRVCLIGCAAKKGPKACKASELYVSPLFRSALAHGRATADHVFIVSARHGLLTLDQEVAPYDFTIGELRTVRERDEWSDRVFRRIEQWVPVPESIEVLLGEAYAKHLRPGLRWRTNIDVRPAPRAWPAATFPLDGLQIGQRLAWLRDALASKGGAS